MEKSGNWNAGVVITLANRWIFTCSFNFNWEVSVADSLGWGAQDSFCSFPLIFKIHKRLIPIHYSGLEGKVTCVYVFRTDFHSVPVIPVPLGCKMDFERLPVEIEYWLQSFRVIFFWLLMNFLFTGRDWGKKKISRCLCVIFCLEFYVELNLSY